MKNAVNILTFFISLILCVLTIVVIPNEFFEKYKIERIKEASVSEKTTYYYKDIDNDNIIEKIDYCKFESPGNTIYIRRNNTLLNNYLPEKNETFINKELFFYDIDEDSLINMFFLTGLNQKVFFNILEFSPQDNKFDLEKLYVDSFSLYNNVSDIYNFDMISYEKYIIFDLQSGYSIQPRNTYLFDYENKTIIRTEKNSIVNTRYEVLDLDTGFYILPAFTTASGNSISISEFENMKKSNHQDTIKLLERKKEHVYKYGDFSSYTMLYNQNLKHVFEPIEYYGWTKSTCSSFIRKNNIDYILSLTYDVLDSAFKSELIIYDLKGNEINKMKFSEYKYVRFQVFNNDKIVLNVNTDNFLNVYNIDFELIKRFDDITGYIGVYDIDNDYKEEIITLKKNNLFVISSDMKHTTSYDLGECKDNFKMSNTRINTYYKDNKTIFYFPSESFLYFLTYKHNNFAVLKIPIYGLILISWFLIIKVLLKLNSKRLEAENIKLEKKISERTIEITQKNEELLSQKEEIQSQAEVLKVQNEHLEKLGDFKKTLTETIIHDLKNPLNTILSKSVDKQIIKSGKKMLNLVMNILDIEKYEHSELKLNKELHSLKEIIRNLISDFEANFEEKNLKIIHYFTDYEIYADIEVLQRVFENLLSNAIRFSPQNSKIEIFAQENQNNLILIEIRNYGIKIPIENLEKIFYKFNQSDIYNSSNYKSTGLGLTYCKMIIEAHGNTIWAENIEPHGVSFKFTISGKKYKRKDENNNDFENSLKFSDEEKSLLKKYIKQLKEIEFYNATKIISVLNQIPEKTDKIVKWKFHITSSLFSNNYQYFIHLIENI